VARRRAAEGLFLAVIALGALPATEARAQGRDPIEGTWFVEVTLRNCQSQAPLGAPFYSVLTFASGGSIIDQGGTRGFAPGQKGIGLGAWKRDGPGRYSANTTTLIFFTTAPAPPTSPGFTEGAQILSQQIVLTDSANFTAVASSQFYDLGARPYRSGCSTAAGRRFQ
jgi:hypothetical protein